MHKYTPEQRAFIKKNCIGHSYAELRDMVNSKFDLQLTLGQIKGYLGNHKLKTGRTGRFGKGHIPANKGKKGVGGWEPTQFKKGNAPVNYRPVGSERVNVDGYTEIKVADPNKWKLKHRILWEKEKGPIPKGYNIIFGDGNKLNLDINNLILVSRGELAVLNHKGLIQDDADLTRSGILVTKLIMKCSARKKVKNARCSGRIKRKEVKT